MLIPYSTDAPVYHLPIATVGLIVVNTLVFLAYVSGSMTNPEQWILPYGVGLTPLQWLTSIFMHENFDHLLGNMLFLWVFGLVIEGKIGWHRFLACYLSIGIGQSMIEQTLQLALGGVGGSLGASSAIYGIMAMAAIWAPKNEIHVFYWFLMIYTGTFEVSIMVVAILYIGLDLVFMTFSGFSSSSWLHIGGAMLGAPLAIAMLKLGAVDCEKWDIFHVLRDDEGGLEEKRRREDPAELAKLKEQRDSKILDEGKTQLEKFMVSGYYLPAFALYQKLRDFGDGIELSRMQLLKMVAALHQEKRWRDSCPLMAELVERYPEQSQEVKVKLAQICVLELQKPGRALDLLKSLDLQSLPPKVLSLVQKIALRAKQMQAEGVVELDDDAW